MCNKVKALSTRNPRTHHCAQCDGPIPMLWVNVVLCEQHGANLLCDECYEVAQ